MERPPRRPLAPAILLTALSGVLYALAFPPVSARPLAWVAVAPFLFAIRRTRAPGLLGWLWGVVMPCALGYWLPGTLAAYLGCPRALAVAAFVGLLSVLIAPFYMAFAAAYAALAGRFGAGLPLLAGGAWAAVELARTTFVHNGWGLLGYSQSGLALPAQIADLAGVYGISFVLVVTNAALVEAALARHAARRAAALAPAAVLLVATFVYGSHRLAEASAMRPKIRVAAVQADLDPRAQWNDAARAENVRAYLSLTRRVLAQRPRIVLWPENAVPFSLPDHAASRREIGRVLAGAGMELVTGAPRRLGSSPGTYRTSAFLVSAEGHVGAWADKERLVPLAEYAPLPGYARDDSGMGRLTPGTTAEPLATRAGPAGVAICHDALFPDVVAARVRAGAAFLLNPANDGWFGSAFAAEVMDMVRLRAVEQRRFLVRASTSGPSAIIDPYGRIVGLTKSHARAVVVGNVEPRTALTPYARVGDRLTAAAGLVAFGLAVASARRRPRVGRVGGRAIVATV